MKWMRKNAIELRLITEIDKIELNNTQPSEDHRDGNVRQ